MTDYIIEISKDMKLETIYEIMLPSNYRAIHLLMKMGFTIQHLNGDTVKATLDLKEEVRTN
jgi:ribosomal protein S18 acetylase RimI-like enzyme